MPALRASAVSEASSDATSARLRAPGVMLQRASGALNALLACGIARRADANVIELLLDAAEAASGGMVAISMPVAVHCPACAEEGLQACLHCRGAGSIEELFSAWLAVPPGVSEGTLLLPSALLPGMIDRVTFRVRLDPP